MKRFALQYGFLFLLFTINTLGWAQTRQFTNYSLKEGLPQSQVYCIAEDNKGYLWVGTRGGGVARFDGLNFETFTTKEGLSGNYINDITIHGNQVIVATNAGLTTIENSIFLNDSNYQDQGVANYAQDSTEAMVLANGKVYINTENERNIFELGVSNIRRLVGEWAYSNNVIYNLNTKGSTRFQWPIESILPQDSGMWIGTYGHGLWYWDFKTFFQMNGKIPLSDAIIHHLYEHDNQLWVATLNSGVCAFNYADSTYTFITENNGLANNHVRVTFADSWGNIWFGTSGGGLSKYTGKPFATYNKSTGLKGDYIYSVYHDQENKLWVGTSGGGVIHYDTVIHYLDEEAGLTDLKIKEIHQVKDSIMCFGSDGGGMFLFFEDTIISINEKDGLAGNWVKDIVDDKNGALWVATSGGGISKVVLDTTYHFAIENYRIKDGLISNRIVCLTVDDGNRLWYGTQSKGIAVIGGESLTKAQGLQSDNIRCFLSDKNGFWIGHSRGMDFIQTADSVAVFNLKGEVELSSQNVYSLEKDGDGNYWVGTERGLDRLRIEDFQLIEKEHFDQEDGFDGVETNLKASSVDQEGNVWFGTVDGLYQHLSENNVANNKSPVLSFNQVLLNDLPVEAYPQTLSIGLSGIVIPYGQNKVNFDFVGINLKSPNQVWYKWKLEGVDTAFTSPSQQHQINYSNLQPGAYQFLVHAMNEDGIWTLKPLQFRFTVTTPIWQETWFIVAAALVFIVLIVILYRARIKAAKRKLKVKEEKLKMERDLVQLEQKALQLQMNPHFIFHTLGSIQELIATKDNETARKYLTQFSKLMRQILEGSRENSVSLEREIKTLNNYLSLEQFCHEDKFDFNIAFDENEELEFIEIPSMILQPYVENAIIHGALKAEGRGSISVEFKILETEVIVQITDNGPGFGETKKDTSHKSAAMQITKERLRLLSGKENCVRSLATETGAKMEIVLPIINEG